MECTKKYRIDINIVRTVFKNSIAMDIAHTKPKCIDIFIPFYELGSLF